MLDPEKAALFIVEVQGALARIMNRDENLFWRYGEKFEGGQKPFYKLARPTGFEPVTS